MAAYEASKKYISYQNEYENKISKATIKRGEQQKLEQNKKQEPDNTGEKVEDSINPQENTNVYYWILLPIALLFFIVIARGARKAK